FGAGAVVDRERAQVVDAGHVEVRQQVGGGRPLGAGAEDHGVAVGVVDDDGDAGGRLQVLAAAEIVGVGEAGVAGGKAVVHQQTGLRVHGDLQGLRRPEVEGGGEGGGVRHRVEAGGKGRQM